MKKDPTGITGGPGMSDTDAAICAYLTLASPVIKDLAVETVQLERALPDGMIIKAMAQSISAHVQYLAECTKALVETLQKIDPEEWDR